MLKTIILLVVTCTLLAGPEYTKSGGMKFPADYREWVYLSSGVDMSYGPAAPTTGSAHVFDNVFVDRPSYQSFLQTGHWPDKTTLVLEVRRGESKGSINRNGAFQGPLTDLEVHVKDSARFKEGWAFYSFAGTNAGTLFPQSAACYSCHEQHGAVETTFVQFYPTLMPIAQAKGTATRE